MQTIKTPHVIVMCIIVLALVVLGVWFWKTSHESVVQEVANFGTPITYACATGGVMEVSFADRIVRIALPDNREITLEQSEADSGEVYANEGGQFVFQTMQDDVSLQENGVVTFSDCVTQTSTL